jgi:hypothetical protein
MPRPATRAVASEDHRIPLYSKHCSPHLDWSGAPVRGPPVGAEVGGDPGGEMTVGLGKHTISGPLRDESEVLAGVLSPSISARIARQTGS